MISTKQITAPREIRGWNKVMSTSYIHRVLDEKGIHEAFNLACESVRQKEAEMMALWESRFFERRVLDNGTKKLWPTTATQISTAYDLQDCHGPVPEFFYCDDDGELYPISVGNQSRTEPDPDGPDEVPFVYAAADIVANGKVVGAVFYTDH